MPALRAGLVYWALIFAIGFALGTVRTLWLAPALGPLAAVAIELPVMLGASWLVATRLTAKFAIASSGQALTMGLSAFTLLMLSELALGAGLGGQSLGQWAASLTTPSGALGLAGQVLFAAMPLAARRRSLGPA